MNSQNLEIDGIKTNLKKLLSGPRSYELPPDLLRAVEDFNRHYLYLARRARSGLRRSSFAPENTYEETTPFAKEVAQTLENAMRNLWFRI